MKLFILGYLLLLNLLSWYAMYDDKRKSINGEWRTSESSLLFFCLTFLLYIILCKSQYNFDFSL